MRSPGRYRCAVGARTVVRNRCPGGGRDVTYIYYGCYCRSPSFAPFVPGGFGGRCFGCALFRTCGHVDMWICGVRCAVCGVRCRAACGLSGWWTTGGGMKNGRSDDPRITDSVRSRGRRFCEECAGCSTAEAKAPAAGYLTALTIASNAFGSFMARSARTLRFSSIPLALSLPMNCE